MTEREHLLQWVVIYEKEKGNAEYEHQFDKNGDQLYNFSFIQDLGEYAKVLMLIPVDQRVGTGKPLGNPFLAVDLTNGAFNINGTEWEDMMLPDALVQRREENEKKKLEAIREARAEKEQEAYDAMVEETWEWEDRKAATEAARQAKKLSAEEYAEIDSKAIAALDIEPIVFRPIYYATTQEDKIADESGKLITVRPPRFKYYKLGWQCTIDDENYQRVVYADMDTNRFLLRGKG